MKESERETWQQKVVTLTTDATTTPEIDISHWASGSVFIKAAETMVTLTYHTAPRYGGIYLPAQDASGNAVTQTVAHTKAYPIPSTVFGAGAIRIVANAAGEVAISLKS